MPIVGITWRSYFWHYFSAIFCPWKPSWWRMGWHTVRATALRCEHCHAPWGMCHHTGGPFSGPNDFDRRAEWYYTNSVTLSDLRDRERKR